MEKYFQELLDTAYARIGTLEAQVKNERDYKESAQREKKRIEEESLQKTTKIMQLEKEIDGLKKEIDNWKFRWEAIFKNKEVLEKMEKPKNQFENVMLKI